MDLGLQLDALDRGVPDVLVLAAQDCAEGLGQRIAAGVEAHGRRRLVVVVLVVEGRHVQLHVPVEPVALEADLVGVERLGSERGDLCGHVGPGRDPAAFEPGREADVGHQVRGPLVLCVRPVVPMAAVIDAGHAVQAAERQEGRRAVEIEACEGVGLALVRVTHATGEGQPVGGLPFEVAEGGFRVGHRRIVLQEVEGRLVQSAVDAGQEWIVLAALIDGALMVVDAPHRVEQGVVQQGAVEAVFLAELVMGEVGLLQHLGHGRAAVIVGGDGAIVPVGGDRGQLQLVAEVVLQVA